MKIFFVYLILLCSISVFATTNINYLQEEPKLDGSDFNGATKVCGFIDPLNTGNFSFQCGWTDKGIYINLVSYQNKLMANMDSSFHDAVISSDDSFEIFLAPKNQYYQFIVNSNNAKYDSVGADTSWDTDWKTFSKVEGDRWTCQVFIPFSKDLPKPNENDTWKFNICRDFKYPMLWASCFTKGSYFALDEFDTLLFTKNNFVSIDKLDLSKNIKSLLSVVSEKDLKLEWSIKNDEGQGLGQGKTEIKKGNNDIELTCPVPPSANKDNFFEYSFTDGDKVINSRTVKFNPADDMTVEVVPNPSERIVTLNIKSSLNNAEICGVIVNDEEFQASLEDNKTSVTVPMAYLNEGKNTFICKVYDENDESVATKEISLQISDKPVWLDNNLGLDDTVPAPWTPVVFTNNKIGVWNREYDFGDNPLPKSIISQGENLLAGDIVFDGAFNGEKLNWKNSGEKKTIKENQSLVEFERNASSGDLSMTCKTTCEFDGLLRFDVTLTPNVKGKLNNLVLKIPISKDIAKLHYDYAYTFGGGPGFIMPTEEHMMGKLELPYSSQFLPVMWVGDPDKGMAFLCESLENWNLSDTQNAITVEDTGKEALMCINFVDTETDLEKPLKYTFGFNVTPAKPLPRQEDWMTFRPVTMVGDRLFFTCWGGSTRWQGFPVAGNHTLKSGDPNEFDDTNFVNELKGLRERNLTLPTYLTPSALVTDIPEFVYYRDEWKSVPEVITGTDSGQEIMLACINDKKLQDCYLYYLNDFMTKYDVDGIYMDFSHLQRCANPKHNCGYEKDGKREPAWPIFGYHEMHKRIYKVMAKCKPNAPLRVFGHCSGGKNLPHINFWDVTVDGEYLNVDIMGPKYKGDYTAYYRNMDRFVTEYNIKGWGTIPLFDAYNKTPEGTRCEHAYAVQVGAVPWSWLDYQTQAKFWTDMDLFGVDKITEFLPYWNNKGVVKWTGENVYVATYRNENKTLFAITNLQPDTTNVELTFDKEYLGLGNKEFKVLDLSTGEVLSDNNKVFVDVNGKDYRLIMCE